MDRSDPHIHVEAGLNTDAAVRDILASTFGLAGDSPSVVTAGCGLQVPYAMTSRRPESVTCLPCREHAHRQHLRFAEQVEHLGSTPGVDVSIEQARRAAEEHRDLAKRFSSTDG